MRHTIVGNMRKSISSNSLIKRGTIKSNAQRVNTGSQFFSVANEQDGHDMDFSREAMRNTY